MRSDCSFFLSESTQPEKASWVVNTIHVRGLAYDVCLYGNVEFSESDIPLSFFKACTELEKHTVNFNKCMEKSDLFEQLYLRDVPEASYPMRWGGIVRGENFFHFIFAFSIDSRKFIAFDIMPSPTKIGYELDKYRKDKNVTHNNIIVADSKSSLIHAINQYYLDTYGTTISCKIGNLYYNSPSERIISSLCQELFISDLNLITDEDSVEQESSLKTQLTMN